MTRNGIATNVSATMTPAVVNGNVMPVHSSRSRPRMPWRPKARSRATPPTTGGSTNGSVTRARSTEIPRTRERARTQANDTPNTSDTAVAALAHTNDNLRASRTWLSANSRGRPRQGARTRSPAKGTSRNSAASNAGTPSGHGIVPRACIARASCRERWAGPCPPGGRSMEVMAASASVLQWPRSGLGEPGSGQDGGAGRRQDVVGELLGGGLVGRPGQDGDRVLGRGVDALGDLDAPDLGTSGPHVGDVDDPGINLAQGDLGQNNLDVNLLSDRGHGEPGVGEDLGGCSAARNGDLTQGHLHAGLGQVGQLGDVGGVLWGNRDLHDVAGEVLRGAGPSGLDDPVHVPGAGRGKDVGGCTLGDLSREAGARTEVEYDVGAAVGGSELLTELGERLPQGGCGEDVDSASHRRGAQHRRRGRRGVGGGGGGGGGGAG